MRIALVGAFLSLLTVVFAGSYHIHAFYGDISANDIRGIENDRASFLEYENVASEKLTELLLGNVEDFYIDHFEIHGEDIQRSTAIFYAFFTSHLSRDDIIKAIGEKENFLVFYCQEMEQLPPAPILEAEAAPQSLNCLNGGVALPNNTCSCPPFYFGNNCALPHCQNGGIVDTSTSKCSCPPGVYSMNCESRGCLPGIEANFDNSKQSFILVINTRSTMAQVLNTLIGEMADIVKPYTSFTANYILVTYVNTASATYMNSKIYTTQQEFLYAVYSINIVSGTDQQANLRATYAALDTFPQMKGFSNVFVFADSHDSTANAVDYELSNTNYENVAILQALAWRARISFFLSSSSNNPANTTGDGYDVYRRVSKATLGDLVTYDQSEIMKITILLDSYKQNENLAVRYQYASDATIDLYGDHDQQFIYILVTVEPSGTLPTVQGDKGSSLLVDVKGSKFQQYRATMAVTSSLTVSGGTKWNIRCYVQSLQSAIVSYSSDNAVDIGTSYTPAEIPVFTNAAILPLASGSAISIGILDNTYASVNGDHFTQGTPRDGCTYATTFGQSDGVSQTGPYGIHARIKDALGNVVDRVIPGMYFKYVHHGPTPFTCFNGGTNSSPNSCNCTSNFGGSDCSTPLCQYGGSVNPFPNGNSDLCLCKRGFSGNFCEKLDCTSGGPATFDNRNRTFAIIIQNSFSQAQIYPNISSGVYNLFSSMTGTDAYTQYVLTTFVQPYGANYSMVPSHSYFDKDDFLYAFQEENIQYKAVSIDTIRQASFAALQKTIQQTIYIKSSIVLFTDSPPTQDYDANDIINNAIENQLDISIIVTPKYGDDEDDCPSPSEASLYENIADSTGGVFINLCNIYEGNYAASPIEQFFSSYAATHHHTEVIDQFTFPCYKTYSLNMVAPTTSDPYYVTVSSTLTENFTVVSSNLDNLTQNYSLSATNSMPFFSTYSLSTASGNKNGYQIYVSAGAQADGQGSCTAKILQKTSASVFFGYAEAPNLDVSSGSLRYGIPLSPVAHLQNFDGSNSSVLTKAKNYQGQESYNDTAQLRLSSCFYEQYYLKPFSCTARNSVFVLKSLITTSSGIFQRSQRAFCYLPDSFCLNGGSWNDDDGDCDCPSDYNGNNCEDPVCRNGGTVANFACQCPNGYTGQFCQYRQCDSWNYMETADVRQNNYVQITFVLETIQNQLLINILLNNSIQQFVTESDRNGLPKMFTLIIFDEANVNNLISTTSPTDFLNAFNYAVQTFSSTPDISQTMSMEALNQAYKLTIQPPALIYVFTSSEMMFAADYNTFLRQKIGTQVNLFYTPSGGTVQMPAPSSLLFYLGKIARQSGGRVLPLSFNGVSQIESALVSSLNENALVHDIAAQSRFGIFSKYQNDKNIPNIEHLTCSDCTTAQTFYFAMEEVFQKVVIDVSGTGVTSSSISVLDGYKNVITPRIILSDSYSIILDIESSAVAQAGVWSIIVKTTAGPCYVQVRNSSPIRVIPGFSSSPTSDQPSSSPYNTLGTDFPDSTYMTFRVIDQLKTGGSSVSTLSYAFTSYYSDWTSYSLNNKQIVPRDPDGCASQFVSDVMPISDISSGKYIVQGTDNGNVQFQRTFFFNQPSSADNKPTCQNGQRTPSGQCRCDDQYTGEYCDQQLCQNGGSQSYGICVCPNGYYGSFCENYLS